MRKTKNIILSLLLATCFTTSAQTIEEVVTSPTTFAVCKTADVASTIYLLNSGIGIEANPIVAWSIKVGGYFPLILVSGGIYYLLKTQNEPVATGIANIVTCPVAVHNLLLIH